MTSISIHIPLARRDVRISPTRLLGGNNLWFSHHIPLINDADKLITGPPDGPVLFCSLASVVWRLSASSVGVCNAAGGRAGRPPGAWEVGAAAAGHCTANQYGYVRLRWHLVCSVFHQQTFCLIWLHIVPFHVQYVEFISGRLHRPCCYPLRVADRSRGEIGFSPASVYLFIRTIYLKTDAAEITSLTYKCSTMSRPTMADGLPTCGHLQVESRTGKVRRPKADVYVPRNKPLISHNQRLNRSRCHLVVWLMWAQGNIY